MNYGTYALPDTQSGDTLDSQLFRVTRTPSALPELATAECQFRPQNANNCKVALEPTITITDSEAWEFRLNKIPSLDLDPGYYVGSVKLTDVTGRIKNYLHFTLNVTQPPTR